jgi:competence protein CoiA
MKFALVDEQRQEAQRGLSGMCPCCGGPVIPKCGQSRVHHWAHQATLLCDRWWENETAWHRKWKGQFPEHWQEIVLRADDGERHVADVRTDLGWVIEFQHSHITPEERRSRDDLYGKLVWVVDGARLKRAKSQFMKTWEDGTSLGSGEGVRKVFLDGCSLLREWAGSSSPIFFDFGEDHLWWLIASSNDGRVYVGKYSRTEFIETVRGGTEQKPLDIGSLVTWAKSQLATYESNQRALALQQAQLQTLQASRQRLAWTGRRRRF